jgi:O-antigen ligase
VEGSELRAVAFEGFSLLAVVFTLAIISRRYSNRESLDKALIVAGIISCGLALLRLEGTRISEDFARIDGQIALRGAFANPNDLAAFLLITLFAAIRIFFIDLYNRKWRYAAAVYMLFALITILSSGSRAGVVVLMSLICVVFLVIVARAVRAIRVEILIAAFAGFAVFVILLVFSPLSSGIDRVWVEFTQTGTNTGASRIEWFGLAVESIYESWGLGLGSAMAEDYGFNELTNSLANRRGNFHPHNLFVEITVQHGVIGLFLLSTAIYCLFTVSRQGERSNLSLVDSQAFRWSQLFAFMAISLMPSSILDDALLTMSFLGLYLSNPSHV